jgi:hypothetical protein
VEQIQAEHRALQLQKEAQERAKRKILLDKGVCVSFPSAFNFWRKGEWAGLTCFFS